MMLVEEPIASGDQSGSCQRRPVYSITGTHLKVTKGRNANASGVARGNSYADRFNGHLRVQKSDLGSPYAPGGDQMDL